MSLNVCHGDDIYITLGYIMDYISQHHLTLNYILDRKKINKHKRKKEQKGKEDTYLTCGIKGLFVYCFVLEIVRYR